MNDWKPMNQGRIEKIIAAARQEPPPAAPPGLSEAVMRTIRRDGPSRESEPAGLWESLNALFPRVAGAAIALVLLFAAADWAFSSFSDTDLDSGMAQVSDQWLFTAKGF